MLQNLSFRQVGIVDPLVNLTVSLANEAPHAIRELDYVLTGKS